MLGWAGDGRVGAPIGVVRATFGNARATRRRLICRQGSGEMRLMMAAALGAALFSSAKAGVDVNRLAQCDDRNALDDISVDARLVAIKFYYDGFVHGLTDRTRRACYEYGVTDEKPALANRTLDLIERDCSPLRRPRVWPPRARAPSGESNAWGPSQGLKRADSTPTGIASGRTGVRAKAAIRSRARNGLRRPKPKFPADCRTLSIVVDRQAGWFPCQEVFRRQRSVDRLELARRIAQVRRTP